MTIAVTIGGLRDQVSSVEAGCVTLLDHLEYIDQSDHECGGKVTKGHVKTYLSDSGAVLDIRSGAHLIILDGHLNRGQPIRTRGNGPMRGHHRSFDQ